jgi:hypothetical protein
MGLTRGPGAARAGLTIVELVIAFALVGVVLVKVVTISDLTSKSVSRESAALAIEDQARLLLDRLAQALISCDRETLAPVLTGGHTSELNYQYSLGVEGNSVVWSELERITLGGLAGNDLVWMQSPDQPGERRAVLSRNVLPLLIGEEINDEDDNGNGLIDERGLSFEIDGNRVTIRLGLGRLLSDGESTSRSVATTITIRNNPMTP